MVGEGLAPPSLEYGNGDRVKYSYDALDRIKEIWYNNVKAYTYEYNSMGSVHSVTDHGANEVTVYEYDMLGKLVKTYGYDQDTYQNLMATDVMYDKESRVIGTKFYWDYLSSTGVATEQMDHSYAYSGATGNLSSATITSGGLVGTITPTYNNLGQTTARTLVLQKSSGTRLFYNQQSFTYESGSSGYSGRVSQFTQTVGRTTASSVTTTTYRYTYDANGNITKITDGNNVVQYQYAYDALGQLIREDNRPLNKTYVYTYDTAGNILNKKSYTFTLGSISGSASTTNYTYADSQWGDLLTEHLYDDIIYDEIGNPWKKGYQISGDEFEFGYEYSWNGRQLTSIKYFDMFSNPYYMLTLDFTYNADGIRTSKTVNGVEHKYYLNGSQILAETWTEDNVEYMLVFVYDETGAPIAMKYRDSSYAKDTYDIFLYEKNLQGDIIAIYNSSGTKIGTYDYDAWGAPTTTINLGPTFERSIVTTYNPFRYRGYYYDTETSLYYLQSRYYDPAMARFINADGYVSTGQGLLGYNMFAYCNNNPVMNVDPSGDFPWLALIIIATFALTGGVMGAMADVDLTNPQNIQSDDSSMDESIDSDASESRKPEKLPLEVRVKNTLLGFGLGLAVGGAVVATGGVFMGTIGGVSYTAFGATAAQTFAWGALAFDFSAIGIMPFFGVEMEPIECGPAPQPQLPQNK